MVYIEPISPVAWLGLSPGAGRAGGNGVFNSAERNVYLTFLIMKLKKLEMNGFKSFAEKVSFEIDGAFTALVGPNGSGKSNVVDAIKWVLGEQSAKKLRGNEMSDMIFNGSDTRRALGCAEVRVTIDNQQGLLPVEYGEVCISRRVFRSGESTYALNGKNCRLKEIRNLLLDTGVGASAYSIIEQGQIDMLLQASSKERRTVLEEAAGINRYLEQKKEAERKLERVKDNLQRVADIVEELERQLRSVRRQAAKARRYKKYKDEWLRLKLSHALFEKAKLLKRRSELASERDEAVRNEAEAGREMQEIRDAFARQQSDIESGRRELAAFEEKSSHLDARIYSLDKEIKLNIARRRELHERLEKLASRHAQFRQSESSVRDELNGARANLDGSSAELKQTHQLIEEAKTGLREAESEHQSARDRVESGKNAVFELMQRQSQVQNQINMLHSEIRTLGNRLTRNTERRQEITGKQREIEMKRCNEQERLSALQEHLQRLERESESVEDSLSRARLELDNLTSDLGDVKAELQGKMGRKQVLEDLQARSDGVGSGVKMLINEVQKDDSPVSGCPGMLGALLNVSSRHSRAVEAALGQYVQAVVVQTSEQAGYCLELLRRQGKGRAYIIPLDAIDRNEKNPKTAMPHNPRLTALDELVDCPESISGVVRALLGDCYLAQNTESAEAIFRNADHAPLRVVTAAGDMFESNGIRGAGEPESGGFISRRSELAELNVEVDQIKERLTRLSENAGRCSRKVEELHSSRRTLLAEKERIQREEHDTANRVSVIQSQGKQVCEELRVLEEDADALKQDTEQAQKSVKTKGEEDRTLAGEKAAREENLAETQKLQARLADRCTALRNSHSELMNRTSRLEEQHKAARALIERLKRQLAENDEEIGRIAEESEACKADMERAGLAVKNAENESSGLRAEQDAVRKRTKTLREQIAELSESMISAQRESEAAEKHLRSAEKSVQKIEMAENENALTLTNLHQRIGEECGIDLSALELAPEQWRETPLYTDAQIEEYCREPDNMAASESVARWYAEECRQESQQTNEEESEGPVLVRLEDAVRLQKEVFSLMQSPRTEWDEIRREAASLKGKIERMGGANLESIREQDELEIRAEFLTGQREDLEKARRHELEIIRELSKKSRTKFITTFETVRENFQIIIRKLFGGGSGDLTLEQDSDDVLEAGIEISVRPPGKETRSISLLSGGEKALTAVALLFAIFESKPSPFCLLDEVDAPLDEANVGRFLALLEQYKANTQFLIVTHNKVTMSAAETLFGVSMNNDGASKKVVINFEEVDRQLREMEHETARARAG